MEITVEESCISGMWFVNVRIPDGRMYPTEFASIEMTRCARISFDGKHAKILALQAKQQLEFVLEPLKESVPNDLIDSLLEGIAKQVGAMQMATGPNTLYGEVVRGYKKEDAWKSLVHRTAIAERDREEATSKLNIALIRNWELEQQIASLKSKLESVGK